MLMLRLDAVLWADVQTSTIEKITWRVLIASMKVGVDEADRSDLIEFVSQYYQYLLVMQQCSIM